MDKPIKNIIAKTPYQGTFAAQRKHDIHTGFDIYCNVKEPVYAIEKGKVINISHFTGKEADSDWWNETKAILIEGHSGIILYGEVEPLVKIDEFIEEIQNEKPASSVKWLGKYLKKIKVIYAFQMLTAGFDDGNFEILSSIKNKIWNITGGILQADNEGFSNEDGYHILWQFADSVTGKWSCAVLDIFGNWKKFTMDLGDITQRKEFKNGKVPKNAIRL